MPPNATNTKSSTGTRSTSNKMTRKPLAFQEGVKRFFLPLVAALNVPPYSMLFWFSLYVGLLVTAQSPYVRTCLLAYWLYCILETHSPRATRQSPFIRYWQTRLGDMWFIHWTAEYFQTQLIKTVDLNTSDGASYIFNYHPHGVIGMGASLALTTNGCHFQTVFPGIRRTCATLNVTFCAPIYRHWMLWLGCCSANKKTLVGRLTNGDNESLVLIPGGAVEALYAHPQTFVISIKQRYGFIRLARETKAKPIPVLGFGENDIFKTVYHGHGRGTTKQSPQQQQEPPQPSSGSTESDSATKNNDKTTPYNGTPRIKKEQSLVCKLQHYMYKKLSFSTPLWFHLLPQRKIPLTVVVGAPVEFPPSASLEECHQLYLEALTKLYEEHKDIYGYKDVPMVVV